MLRLLLLPFAIVGLALAAIAPLGWVFFFHDHIRPNWDPNLVYTGDLNTQRHLASCYMSGCAHFARSPLLACAWREIILEEIGTPSAADLEEVDKACGALSATDRSVLKSVEDGIRLRTSQHFDLQIPLSLAGQKFRFGSPPHFASGELGPQVKSDDVALLIAAIGH